MKALWLEYHVGDAMHFLFGCHPARWAKRKTKGTPSDWASSVPEALIPVSLRRLPKPVRLVLALANSGVASCESCGMATERGEDGKTLCRPCRNAQLFRAAKTP